MALSDPHRVDLPLIAPFGCKNCRDQHLRCDRDLPACGRCRATHKACTRGYKFRIQSGPFARRQQWVKTPKRLEFVTDGVTGEPDLYDEEDDDDAEAEHSDRQSRTSAHGPLGLELQDAGWTSPRARRSQVAAGSAASAAPRRSSRLTRTGRPSVADSAAAKAILPAHAHAQAQVQAQQPTPPARHPSFGLEVVDLAPPLPYAQPHAQPHTNLSTSAPRSPTDRFIVHDDLLEAPPSLTLTPAERAANPHIYRDSTVYPLQDKQEAVLLRHFIQNLAIWLDLCEPAQQFGTIVPQRAGTCMVLLNAIYALAAKHLAHHGSFDRYASDHYHQQCLDVLIPMLSHDATAADENLFAATIILRVWEEMEFKHSGFDSQGYLLGIHAFVHGHGRKILPNTLSAASFWVGLRQEIYTATVNQQPVKAPLVATLAAGARDLGPAKDHDWANRAVIHCVDVLNFCFGDTPPQQQAWEDLYGWNRRWTQLRPPSYTPTYFRERGADEAFPEIWYHTSWHVTGVQHHILAELFLVSFDPKTPRIGSQRREAAKRVNGRICDLVRQICGIGLGNQWTPPGMFTACMAIAAFGDRFQERLEQEALLDMLRRTDKDHGRPTEAVQRQLMQSWDWHAEGHV